MGFELLDIFAYVASGAYFLIIAGVLEKTLPRATPFRSASVTTLASGESVAALAFLTFAFSIGLFGENLGDGRADEGSLPFTASDDDLKLSVLRDSPTALRPLGLELIETGLPAAMGLDLYEDEPSVKGAYFHAKGLVLLRPTYYDELEKLQIQIDFARAMAVLSVALLLISAGCLALGLRNTAEFAASRWAVWSAVVLLVLLGSVQLYEAEEREYNSRIFGYFVSIFRLDGETALP